MFFLYLYQKSIFTHIFQKLVKHVFKYFYQQVHTGKEKYYTQYRGTIYGILY